MTDKNYYIVPGYKPREENATLAKNREEPYWLNWRIHMSRFYQYHVYTCARTLIKKKKLHSVLDLGCGVATKLMQIIYPVCPDICGVDQAEAIAHCRARYPHGRWVVDDFENPSFLNRTFDLIIAADVIEHLLNPDLLLDYIKKVSHSGSFILISTPERDLHRGIGCMHSPKPEHVREWNSSEFIDYITHRDLTVIEHKIIPFIKWAFDKRVRRNIKEVKKRA